MKALETEYKGILFRSRLEARWAVLFDSFNLKWVYEPECFILSNGQKYTPDFYINEMNLYIEIKPNFDWMNNEYHFNRYKLFDRDLLILSDTYTGFYVNKLYHNYENERIENDVVFIPNNNKYGNFWFTGNNLGSDEDGYNNEYKSNLDIVKKYRFYEF
jgi:hypothetical protein